MDRLFQVVFTVLVLASIAESNCPDGWIRHSGVCYLISHDTEPMPIAADICKHMGGRIAEIDGISENAFLSSEARLIGQSVWIGLNDIQEEGIWKWYDSKRTLNSTGFTGWGPNQPNNGDGRENCVYINRNAEWQDGQCQSTLHYFCEKLDEVVNIVG